MPPTVAEVLIAIFAVLTGCLVATSSFHAARSSGNWLYYICTLGSSAFVAGIVGQRVFPTAATVARLGAVAASTSTPGPWDAGVSLPVVGIRMTPVAVAGMLIAAIGLSMVLLFERVQDARPAPMRTVGRLEDDDSV